MFKSFPRLALLAIATIAIVAGTSQIFQPSFALTNGGSITALNVPLTENFDALASTGTGIVWSDNATVAGAYSSRATYNSGTGSSNTGALYSFGVAGAGAVTDRALGSVGSGSTGTIYWGVRLINNTGTTITSLQVSYTGEQWRNGGATSPNVSVAQTVDFQYQIAPAATITAINTPATGWLDYNALDFTSPTFGTTASATLDGNVAANRVALSSTIPVNIPNGQEIWLRWVDIDHPGNDHGMAIDDLSITASGDGGGDSAPSVTTTTPAAGASNIGVTAPIVINFSESVAAAAGAFAVECPAGTPQSIGVNGSVDATHGTSFTLTPTGLPYSTACTVTVDKDKITDTDAIDPPDTMDLPKVFTFTTAAAPAPLTASSPQAGNASLAADSNIVINFSRSVTANATAFSLSCGSAISMAVTGSPGTAITLNPDVDLPFSSDCTVIADASQIFAAEPPTQMASNFTFGFHTASRPVATNVMINEVDSDTPGDDRAEFIELFGPPNTPLDGLVVVLYNGTSSFSPNPFEHQSYAAFDLDGKSTDANGYFVLGNPDVPNVGLPFDPGQFGLLQNGPDAVALYVGSASDFPNGTPASGALPQTGLVDAVVYDTDDADDAFLKALLSNNQQPQVNENASGDGQHQSIARCANGTGGMRNTSTYLPATPTPGGENVCPASRPPSDIVISQIYGGGGNSGATYQNDYVQLFNKGTSAVDIGGWSLQYASTTGTSWTNKQPLGGIIQPGEYYLIGLGSNGTTGAPLADPPGTPEGTVPSRTPNISGAINLSATNGKVALVRSGESLAGSCPVFNPAVMDFVGYGSTTDCSEGPTKAPTISNTTADFRNHNGATDTDVNGSDFVSAAPNPFRTAPIQELPPFIFATDPPSGGINVPRDPTITLTFTEAVDVDADWFNVACDSGPHNSASVAGAGPFKDITLNDPLTPGERCTVTIDHTKVHDSDTDDSSPLYDLLPEDVSWSFTVATGTPPPYPASVHLTFGNPSGATADLNTPNNFLMEKPEFALSYDRDLGRPNWVSWHLSNEWTGSLARNDTFRADPAIPDLPEWYRVQSFDFSGSGFDRGHMTPNADRDKETSIPINQATFLMTNMVAQAPDNNQGPWAAFEGYLRTLTDPGTSEAYIIAGPSGVGGTGSNGDADTIADGHVTVPSATWKVALILDKGTDDVARVSCATRTIAVLMPNVQGIRNEPWESFLTNVDAIEELTGYDFFSNLPTPVQQCIEVGINGNNPPLDEVPPAVECQAADGAWHNNNVTLSCTATDSGSGLASASDASFTLMTTVAGGSEDANASTGTHTVCDKAGNCATAGPIAGNKIDRKAPTAQIASPLNGALYQLNKFVAASFTCGDTGAGISSCLGSAANGAAIDTQSTGAKTFTVNATDAAGNTGGASVGYSVAANTISISNLPASGVTGDSFVPSFNYAGDGTAFVTSLTTKQCTVSGGVVSFVKKGTCTLVPHATAGANFDAADGAAQSFVVDKEKTSNGKR